MRCENYLTAATQVTQGPDKGLLAEAKTAIISQLGEMPFVSNQLQWNMTGFGLPRNLRTGLVGEGYIRFRKINWLSLWILDKHSKNKKVIHKFIVPDTKQVHKRSIFWFMGWMNEWNPCYTITNPVQESLFTKSSRDLDYWPYFVSWPIFLNWRENFLPYFKFIIVNCPTTPICKCLPYIYVGKEI